MLRRAAAALAGALVAAAGLVLGTVLVVGPSLAVARLIVGGVANRTGSAGLAGADPTGGGGG